MTVIPRTLLVVALFAWVPATGTSGLGLTGWAKAARERSPGTSTAAPPGPRSFGAGRVRASPPPGFGLRRAQRWVRPTYACSGIELTPASDIQARIDAQPEGTTFCLGRGVYRLRRAIVAKSDDVFIGRPQTILSGATLLTGFQAAGRYWSIGGQSEDAVADYGTCQPAGYAGCRDANDVYVNDRALSRVMSLARLGPGRFYFDHAAQRIYLGADPAGQKVEVAVTPTAFQGVGVGAYDVTVEGLIVEKFASAPQGDAVTAGRGWLIAGVEARLNHAEGIGGATTTRNDYMHDNGQSGVGGGCCRIVVEGNEISYNNYAHFCACWQAGGGKWANGSGLTLTNNDVHDNVGPGLWTDGSENGIIVHGNIVERNSSNGIDIEISYNAKVSNNIVIGNGTTRSGWLEDAGILVNSSPHVEIAGNTVSANGDGIGVTQWNRGSDPRLGAHQDHDVDVHDNLIMMTTGHSGLLQGIGDTSYYASRDNRFEHNTYYLACGRTRYFIWQAATSSGYYELPFARWQADGQDTGGQAISLC